MDPNNVPTELWLEIFRLLPSTSDLYHLSQSCRRFYDLTIQYLSRDIRWRTPKDVAFHLPVWNSNLELNNYVRSLALCVSTIPEDFGGIIVDMDGAESFRPGTRPSASEQTEEDGLRLTLQHYYDRDKWRRRSYASTFLHDTMLTRVASCTKLASLTFFNVLFSDRHFAIIHALPLLRILRIELCIFGSRSASRVFDHSTLPITELTILNLRRRVSNHFGNELLVFDEDLTHVLTLALARQLRTLCIDSTADIFREVFHSWNPHLPGHGHPPGNGPGPLPLQAILGIATTTSNVNASIIPPNLERLYLQRKHHIPGEKSTTVAGELAFPDPRFYTFLARTQSIKTLSTYHTPGPHHIFAEGMVLNLSNYAGPLDSLGPFVFGRPLEGLVIQRCGNGTREGVNALANLAAHIEERLKFLAVEFKAWDSEIIYAIATLFPRLRRLKITFESGGPDEVSSWIFTSASAFIGLSISSFLWRYLSNCRAQL